MSARRRDREGTHDVELPPPLGARAATFEIAGVEYAVIGFPLPCLTDPHARALSSAERGVAELVIAGTSSEAIAEARGSSLRTVRNQITSIFRKLGVTSRLELAALAAGSGAATEARGLGGAAEPLRPSAAMTASGVAAKLA